MIKRHHYLAIVLAFVVSVAPLHAFQILVDLNQLSGSEAAALQDPYTASTLAADGVEFVSPLNSSQPWRQGTSDTFDNPTWWRNVILNLNGSNYTLSEDIYNTIQSEPSYHTVWDVYGLPVHNGIVYLEPGAYPAYASPADTVLHYDINYMVNQVVDAYYQINSTKVIVLARDFNGLAPYVRQALDWSNFCAGVVFEIGINEAPAAQNDYPGLNLPAGILEALNRGQKCYILLSPQLPIPGRFGPVSDYSTAVSNFVNYLRENLPYGTMQNPNLYFIVAKYGSPNVGFLNGGGGTIPQNSLRSAVAWLKAFRTWGVY